MAELTPMMKQYMETKSQYQDCILFYRLGDFYEMFFEDALTASRELEITLTGKNCGQEEKAPMCGVPYHAVGISAKFCSECGSKMEPVETAKTVEAEVVSENAEHKTEAEAEVEVITEETNTEEAKPETEAAEEAKPADKQ